MKAKKVMAALLAMVMVVGGVTGCGSKKSDSDDGKGSVYFLNFKPEVAEVWEEIAKEYTDETGVEVKVQTAASGTYEQTLKSRWRKMMRRLCSRSMVRSATRTGHSIVQTGQTQRFIVIW